MLPVDVVGVRDRGMRDDSAEAIFGRNSQIIAPSGRRDLVAIDELPLGLETLALGGVHRRLPPDVHQRTGGTVQAAGRGPRAAG